MIDREKALEEEETAEQSSDGVDDDVDDVVVVIDAIVFPFFRVLSATKKNCDVEKATCARSR